MRARSGWIIGLLATLVVATTVALVMWVLPARSDGPAPIAWDREACAHCRMHIGDPSFAAQLQTQDGQTLNFDDPGCLAEFLAANPEVQVDDLWFHRFKGDGWLGADEVGFIEHRPTPMGYGHAAVLRSQPGAIPWDRARQEMVR